jgi:hypothetical protein
MITYEVIVGNIGKVLTTANLTKARHTFNIYKEMSEYGTGRASGEPVWMIADGEEIKFHPGKGDYEC